MRQTEEGWLCIPRDLLGKFRNIGYIIIAKYIKYI